MTITRLLLLTLHLLWFLRFWYEHSGLRTLLRIVLSPVLKARRLKSSGCMAITIAITTATATATADSRHSCSRSRVEFLQPLAPRTRYVKSLIREHFRYVRYIGSRTEKRRSVHNTWQVVYRSE